jgi:hypothetical protein
VRHHLLAVWNPRFAGDAMQAHLRVLYQAAREFRSGRCSEDDLYVWWGKVRSENRTGPLPHLEKILAIETEIDRNDDDPETHVYLTDYQSLYVAHLGEVTRDDPRADRTEKGRVPAYYRKSKLDCDFWFRLWDVRRLVSDDTPTVANELRKLHNVRHHGRPVSIYGGMVELPLIVTESEGTRYFDPEFRRSYIGDKYWIEWDVERAGVGSIERDLRENLFGDRAWLTFGPTARNFLSTAEKLWRDHATDLMFDFSAILLEYCKAIEVRCNHVLRGAMALAEPRIRCYNRDGRSVDVGDGRQLNLRELATFIGDDQERVGFLKGQLSQGSWFTGQLPPVLRELADARGPAAHADAVDRGALQRLRDRLCGIGQEGVFPMLARVGLKGTA